MNGKEKKFTLSTDTDLHFDMLADHTKLKIMPSLMENKSSNISKNLNGSDDDIIDNINSDSLKFNKSSDEKEDQSIHYNQDEYNKQKRLYEYKQQINNNRFSRESPSFQKTENYDNVSKETKKFSDTEKKDNPTLSELRNMEEVPFHMLDEQTQKFKKMEKYAELLAIKNIGIKLTKEYSLHSDYEEMCFEVQYWTNFQKKKDAVNLGKNFLMNAVTAIEFMNERYDPFGLKLKGWSDQMQIGMDSYNTVFGELYEKWKGSGRKMEPEIKLILMISASAVSFHASKKMAEQLPGLDKVLESNPELLNKLQGVINNSISKNGNTKEKTEEEKQRKMYEQMKLLKKQQEKFEEIKKQQEKIDSNTEKIKKQMQKNNPRNIQEILNRIRAQNVVNNADNILNNSSERVTVESTLGKEEIIINSSNDSAPGETLTLGSDGKPKRKKRKGKPTISITT